MTFMKAKMVMKSGTSTSDDDRCEHSSSVESESGTSSWYEIDMSVEEASGDVQTEF